MNDDTTSDLITTGYSSTAITPETNPREFARQMTEDDWDIVLQDPEPAWAVIQYMPAKYRAMYRDTLLKFIDEEDLDAMGAEEDVGAESAGDGDSSHDSGEHVSP